MASSETDPAMITSSPGTHWAGVATRCSAVRSRTHWPAWEERPRGRWAFLGVVIFCLPVGALTCPIPKKHDRSYCISWLRCALPSAAGSARTPSWRSSTSAAKRARGDLGPCRFETLRHPDAAEPDPGSGLTGRERAIADLVASGMSNREIAEQLVISKRTVDSHAEHIFAKLGITSRVQLAVKLLDAEDAIIR